MLHDERFNAEAANYRYLVSAMTGGALGRPARVLDFGCGRGPIVALAAAAGVDIHGADTFAGGFENWRAEIPEAVRERVHRIENGRLPFPDASFDAAISNTVFEHVADPPAALAEIARVLKPGAPFLAIFPTRDCWWEGHVGIFFVHWLKGRAQRAWLSAAYRLGAGYHRATHNRASWTAAHYASLTNDIIYHTAAQVRRWWAHAFGAAPRSLAPDYMRFRRAGTRLAPLARLGDGALSFICHRRAGRVLLAHNGLPSGRG